ncbi:MAG TPA: Rieske 2Fe-2S domain-containing protein, partial [Solirubrobacteraceae bacterium]|nr:Rieske 2Fe-2S domain-containing protein [Solirubrobacteraceae bacterium]
MSASPLEPIVDAIEGAQPLDSVAAPIGKAARSLATGTPGEILSGTWLGHPVHPLLTDVVVGSFTSASLLDLLGADSAAASALITIGAAAYAPTALTGITDWSASEASNPAVRRTGLVHATANVIGAGLYLASLRPRARGQRMKGTLLGLAGLTVMSAGAYLGGHLTYALGVGADQTVFDSGPQDWTTVAAAGELAPGQPRRVIADDTPVLLVRHEHGVHAIHDRCSHRGCSLADGELDGETIVCGCHKSRFAL